MVEIFANVLVIMIYVNWQGKNRASKWNLQNISQQLFLKNHTDKLKSHGYEVTPRKY